MINYGSGEKIEKSFKPIEEKYVEKMRDDNVDERIR